MRLHGCLQVFLSSGRLENDAQMSRRHLLMRHKGALTAAVRRRRHHGPHRRRVAWQQHQAGARGAAQLKVRSMGVRRAARCLAQGARVAPAAHALCRTKTAPACRLETAQRQARGDGRRIPLVWRVETGDLPAQSTLQGAHARRCRLQQLHGWVLVGARIKCICWPAPPPTAWPARMLSQSAAAEALSAGLSGSSGS